jgi:MEMO1 family protein
MTRQAVAAGRFYPGSKKELMGQIGSMVVPQTSLKEVLGVVSPHAGYIYSGPVASELFSKVKITDTVIMLGPNHTGLGEPAALYAGGNWVTPLGSIAIDETIAEAICSRNRLIKRDISAHMHEHSLEVQLPIMQYLKPDFKIVPIIFGLDVLKEYNRLAHTLADVIKESGKRILIVASSDMTHYESRLIAAEKDRSAIDAILRLDETLLLERVAKQHITMCGYLPVAIMIACVKRLGATSSNLIRYSDSGDFTGDYSQVVGYAGIVIE